MALSPLDPGKVYARFGIADAHFITGRLNEALTLFRLCLAERPQDPSVRRRVCSLSALTGEIDEARRIAISLQQDYPHVSLEQLSSANAHRFSFFPRYLEGLQLAGLR